MTRRRGAQSAFKSNKEAQTLSPHEKLNRKDPELTGLRRERYPVPTSPFITLNIKTGKGGEVGLDFPRKTQILVSPRTLDA